MEAKVAEAVGHMALAEDEAAPEQKAALDHSLEKLRERADQAVKLLAEA